MRSSLCATFRKQQQKNHNNKRQTGQTDARRGVSPTPIPKNGGGGLKQRRSGDAEYPTLVLTLRGTGSARSTGGSPVRSSGCVSTRPADRAGVGRICAVEAGELGASRTESERKLSWLASFHQDATLARSDAAILLRSAPPTSSQQSRLQLDFCFFFLFLPPLFYWSRCARRVTCTQCSGMPAGDPMTELDSISPSDMSPAVAFNCRSYSYSTTFFFNLFIVKTIKSTSSGFSDCT